MDSVKKVINYEINGEVVPVWVPSDQLYARGNDEILSNSLSDITYNQSWYKKGLTTFNFLNSGEFHLLKSGIQSTIKNILVKVLSINSDGFSLERYHQYVRDDYSHFKIVSRTRDLFPNDFNFEISKIIPKFESFLSHKLTDVNSDTKEKAHIIVRINRPFSGDYNPPHKDMYEQYDANGILPKFVNFWVPIAGVTNKTSLPIVEGSHLIPESSVSRTLGNSIVGDNEYRVRFVKDWGSNALVRSSVNYGEVLIFSSYLIHGLALNQEKDMTRVALEFRLFRK